MPLHLPLAELEVGKHLYWQIGNLNIHGQVFLSSWIVIGALLAVVVVGTRKMERDPRGVQNLLEFLWDYLRDLARDQIGEKVYRDWLPFIGTLFLFIFVSNWGGALIPWRIVHLLVVSWVLPQPTSTPPWPWPCWCLWRSSMPV